MSLIKPSCIYDRLESILYPLGFYISETEIDNSVDPGINTYEIVITKSIPSIDYHQYFFTIEFNFGDNTSRDQHYDINLDRSLRSVVQVNEIMFKDKGVLVLNCELIV